MDTKAAIFALMTVWGVGTCVAAPALTRDTAKDEAHAAGIDALMDRVWVRDGENAGQPGTMHIFLADGTLVSDSCWETYRLSSWQQLSDTEISWDEDGMTISADIAALTPQELVLNLKLVGGSEEQRYVPATVPYVCPEMPK